MHIYSLGSGGGWGDTAVCLSLEASLPSLFDHPVVTQRYFFPRAEAPREVHWLRTQNAQLACRLAMHPQPGAPLVVHFHGNGEVVADYESHIRWFHDAGASVLFFEYRGYGASTGVPEMAAMLDDVQELKDLLPCPLDDIIVFGRSVGSIYAVEMASTFRQVKGLVLESAVASPMARVMLRAHPGELGATMEELEGEAARLFDHQAKMGRVKCPTLLLHAEHDSLVPVDNAVQLHAWCGSARKELVRLPAGDHNSIMGANLQRYTAAFVDFVDGL